MAKIAVGEQPQVFQIKKFLGINDGTDGDTQLKMGEAAEMRNWRITKDGSLQIRPGTDTMLSFTGDVQGMFYGYVASVKRFIVVADSNFWLIDMGDDEDDTWSKTSIGTMTDDAHTEFFGYSDKLYAINGHQYMVWDGNTSHSFADVTGYIPVVAASRSPSGDESTEYEQVNKLISNRKVWFSSDGAATTYYLPEKPVASIVSIKYRTTGASITPSSTDLTAGTITFSSALLVGTNNIEVEYTMSSNDRAKVCGMKFYETFNGNNDNRVFLYGDGTNQCVYSGITRTEMGGNPTAEYFPDLNVINVGEENTPLTSLVRHFSRMLAFKPSSTYSISYGTVTQESGSVIAAFYVTPVNRIIGNVAPGQVRLVLNNPRSLHESSLYSWKSSSSTGYLTSDERQAKRISDRITTTLSGMDIANCIVFDDEYAQEYYIVDTEAETALVNNYAADAWYIYTAFPVRCFARVGDELYVGTKAASATDGGKLRHFSRDYKNDDGSALDCFWRSGSLAFSKDWKKKYTSKIFVSMLPESYARVTVTARTNKQSSYDDRTIAYSTDLQDYVMAYGFSTFTHMNFNQFSFGTNRQPQMKRLRLKIKKYTYFQLIFKSNTASNTATIVGTDIDVRYSGDVK